MHRYFTLIGLLFLLLPGGGCSESTSPVASPDPTPVPYHPREVPFVTAGHGPLPGEAEVSWWIVSWATFPIEEYLVTVSYEGPITTDNWDQALILDRLPWRKGQVEFREVYGEAEGLVQGATVWFAVRARDDKGNLSRLEHSPRLTLSAEWWIEGHVYDVVGNPIPGIQVTSSPVAYTFQANADGGFRMGPFRNIDKIEVETHEPEPGGSWYRFVQHPLKTLPGLALVSGHDFFLIPCNTLDSRCTLPDNEFISYLRHMTFTTTRDNDPSASILHRWENYPLRVYIPAFLNDAGVPMDEAALIALYIWNDAMGEEYFVRTHDQESANIEFRFEDREHHYGLVSLLSPSGTGVRLGRVIPEKMAVSIDSKLSTPKYVAEVSLHELGHTLGLLNHSDCYVPEYLMVIAGGFGALDRDEPVHLDERRAVECIRYLPQGQDIGGYRVD
ncbi:MAG: hypothetical protein KAH56_06335 [Candidatus Krumholzibacteria bacterium]|nr:hypothetical protein [Candidatus Krumholzibacteria bacterium]